MSRHIYLKWFEEARNDLESGIILKKSEKYNTAVFLFQQAAEKCAKAIHYYYDLQPWGHSVLKLLEKLVETGKSQYENFLSMGREVDRHYTSTRYPDALPSISPKEAYDYEIAERIENQVTDFLQYVEDNIIVHEGDSDE